MLWLFHARPQKESGSKRLQDSLCANILSVTHNDDTQLVIVGEWSALTQAYPKPYYKLAGCSRRSCESSTTVLITSPLMKFPTSVTKTQMCKKGFISVHHYRIDCWINDHAMDCIAWMREELHLHRRPTTKNTGYETIATTPIST